MIESEAILIFLAAGAVVFLITALLAPIIASAIPINRLWPGFCQKLCDLRSLLAFVFGLTVAFFICLCWQEIYDFIHDGSNERRLLFCFLIAAFLLAFVYSWLAVCCRSGFEITDRIWISLVTLMLIAASMFILFIILKAYDVTYDNPELFDAKCAKLLCCVIIVGILLIILRAFGCQYCDGAHIGGDNCRLVKNSIGVLIVLSLIGTYWLIQQCRDCIHANFELGMIGIWWEGKYEGDEGVHLRWAFDAPLSFPENGFDLYRRESNGGSWQKLNAGGEIYPSTTWSGPNSPSRWVDRGIDRLPLEVHDLYQGVNSENFDYLRKILSYSDLYAPLYFVEGHDEPFTNLSLAEQAAASSNEPAAQWQFTPMALIQTMALHPEVARLVGLLYIDRTADPNVEYDYRIVGHWLDQDRDYEIEKISRNNTKPLAAPTLQYANVLPDITKPIPGGGVWETEARVALRWAPVTPDPTIDLGAADGITNVLYKIEKKNLDFIDGPAGIAIEEFYTNVSVPNENGEFIPHNPIAVSPEELNNGDLVWPDYFGHDYWADYGSFDYRVVGFDVFGRQSEPSSPKQVEIIDTVPPPPPVNVEAKIYQRQDSAVQNLRQDEFEKLFPPGSTHEYAIKVSWMWTAQQKLRHPDLKAFRIFYKFSGFELFSEPSNRAQWTNLGSYEGQLGSDKAVTDFEADIPIRFQDPNSPTGFIFPEAFSSSEPPAYYYEEIIKQLDPTLIALITAGDVPAVKYGFVSVGSIDHDPFNNLGAGATPVTVYSVDLTAPPKPPKPVLSIPPGELSRSGDVNLVMRVDPAVDIYRYVFERVSKSDLLDVTNPDPTIALGCNFSVDILEAELQRKSLADKTLLKQVNAISIIPENQSPGFVADVVDKIDATVGSTQIYVAYAIDPAGNKSEPSCPSLPIEITDKMAPRIPVVTKILGADGAIILNWSDSEETDLARFMVYRTREEERLTSKRRMQLVLEADSTGTSMNGQTDTEDASEFLVAGETRLLWHDVNVVPGHTYYYRIVAQDSSGNNSKPSVPAAARAIDLSPPEPPVWEATNEIQIIADANGIDRVALDWQEDMDETELKYLIRRRTLGDAYWLPVSGWVENVTNFTDAKSQTRNTYEYQIRAMDLAGNKSDWSESRLSK